MAMPGRKWRCRRVLPCTASINLLKQSRILKVENRVFSLGQHVTNLNVTAPRMTEKKQQEQQEASVGQNPIQQHCTLITQVLGHNAKQQALLQTQLTRDQSDRWAKLKFPEFRKGKDTISYFYLFEATVQYSGLPEDQYMGVL